MPKMHMRAAKHEVQTRSKMGPGNFALAGIAALMSMTSLENPELAAASVGKEFAPAQTLDRSVRHASSR